MLRIEWVDGFAYRKASGVVPAEAWEQEREEELVDLILGWRTPEHIPWDINVAGRKSSFRHIDFHKG
jgi:hypothetical protein